MKKYFKPFIKSEDWVVVSEFKQQKSTEFFYQSEQDLENIFIEMLQEIGYEYATYIKNSNDLKINLRKKLEELNKTIFSENEWNYIWNEKIANKKFTNIDKTKLIQSRKEEIFSIRRDDGSSKNLKLIDKENYFNNSFQVINQFNNSGKYQNRYDVTILINGLPLVHIELKKRGVDLKEAFKQINRYTKESFWGEDGLFEFVQIFVISNGSETKYFSNTTITHNNNKKQLEQSYVFTSYWADEKNRKIIDLVDFTYYFFYKFVLWSVLAKYCVLENENSQNPKLLVMRPYQIVAVEKIINKIRSAYLNKKWNQDESKGYIWHTTGSGKTLTSFKTATIATRLKENGLHFISKVLFVVDRRDLDSQTQKEYDSFEKGAAQGASNSKNLEQKLNDKNHSIIITTIQKLNKVLKGKTTSNFPILNENVVLIFDECHRSQFGNMQKNIHQKFKKSYIFGFTGTPIFAENSKLQALNTFDQIIKEKKDTENKEEILKDIKLTTRDIFKNELHRYTLEDAIADGNVLGFNYINCLTLKEKNLESDHDIYGIDEKAALMSPKRISKVVKKILNDYPKYTRSDLKNKNKAFNGIFTVENIEFARAYYNEFKHQIALLNEDQKIKVTTIFSANDTNDSELEIDELNQTNKEFLADVIDDFYEMYNQKYIRNSYIDQKRFNTFYGDVAEKIKKTEIDLVIVVNIFLTGFDSKRLNTIWVDRTLKDHGLIQAISRTNRIFNNLKLTGNIVSFRNIEKNLMRAFKIFSSKRINSFIYFDSFKNYYYGNKDFQSLEARYVSYDKNGYKKNVEELFENFPINNSDWLVQKNIQTYKKFVKDFSRILRLDQILRFFPEFTEDKILLNGTKLDDYRSRFITIRSELKKMLNATKESIENDIEYDSEIWEIMQYDLVHILEVTKKDINNNPKITVDELSEVVETKANASYETRKKSELIKGFIQKIQGNPSKMNTIELSIYSNDISKKDLALMFENIKNKNINVNKNLVIDYLNKSLNKNEFDHQTSEFNRLIKSSFRDVNKENNHNDLAELMKNIFDKYNNIIEKFIDPIVE